jgi:hypothetical protein
VSAVPPPREEGIHELREIQTRRTVGGNVEVIAGLREGERIVVRGAETMPRQ